MSNSAFVVHICVHGRQVAIWPDTIRGGQWHHVNTDGLPDSDDRCEFQTDVYKMSAYVVESPKPKHRINQ